MPQGVDGIYQKFQLVLPSGTRVIDPNMVCWYPQLAEENSMGLESIILEEVIKSSVWFDPATKNDAFRLHGYYGRGIGLSLEQHLFCELYPRSRSEAYSRPTQF